MPTTALPWQPLFSVNRSGLPEISIYGLLCVYEGQSGKLLLRRGECEMPLWSRSLLKPWQLMSLMPALKEQYPALQDEHYAMMIASHQGDAKQLDRLYEIAELGGVDLEALQCPVCYPMSAKNADAIKSNLQKPQPVFHPCSGKHLAHLLYWKAQGQPLENYLDPELSLYAPLEHLLEGSLSRSLAIPTTDGCGMPNYALSAVELSMLYARLAQTPDTEITRLMRNYPQWIGGEGRLDTRLIQGEVVSDLPLIAKEGADGLLAVGVIPNERYPQGLGILIKLASGYDSQHLENLIREVFRQLGEQVEPAPMSDHPVLSQAFHFQFQPQHHSYHQAKTTHAVS